MTLLDSQIAWAAAAFIVAFIVVPLFVTVRDRRRFLTGRRVREHERAGPRHVALVEHVRRGEPAVLFDDADLEFTNVRSIRSNVVRLEDRRGDAA